MISTLLLIEAYVKNRNICQKFPLAADIKKNGLDLAEMNLLLLKKLEVQTLHLNAKKRIAR